MKIISYFFLPALMVLFFSGQQGTIKVICIGDSITQGKVINDSITELSYRYWLWEKLDSAGFEVDMLGSNPYWFGESRTNRVAIPVSRYTGHQFDTDHESYYGIRTDAIVNGFTHEKTKYTPLKDRLQKFNKPDVAFVQIGDNDNQRDSLETMNYLKQIAIELYERNSEMKIFLSKLICPWKVYVNHSIEPIVAELKLKYPGMKISHVDLASGWVNCPEVPGTCTFDWVHPNVRGQKIMADKWFKAFLSSDDHKKPKFKSDITVSERTDSTARISWKSGSDNKYIAGYNVYLNGKPANWRYSECGKHDKQCISLVQGTNYTLTGLQKGKEYMISIAAVDFANNLASLKGIKLNIP
jgi:acyl-CoA thioesterase I